MPKKRQTALDVASKLPVAELLPLLARPQLVRLALPNDPTMSPPARPSLMELQAENNRLYGVIAQISGSLLAQNSNDFAGN